MMVEQERECHKNYRAKARVHANVAVAKYWGKRDESLNLPLFDSVAFNVDGLITETQAHWHNDDTRDALIINGWQVPAQSMGRVERILDKIRDIKGWDKRCTLQSRNNFPLASGLASSASGSAAAAAAAAAAAGLELRESELSALARLGSGSAARSIPGGWTRWRTGHLDDGSDSFAESFAPADYWNLHVFVIQVTDSQKSVSSSECMNMCMRSPFWNVFVEESKKEADLLQQAVVQRDFASFSAGVHRNMMRLHALTMTCERPVLYFAPKSVEIIQKVLRATQAVPVCCTVDAGSNVIVICEDSACPFIKNDIIALGLPFIQTHVGNGAQIV